MAPIIASPRAPASTVDGPGPACAKQPGRLRVAFLSRISKKKNLLGALQILHGVRGNVELDIYGPIEDEPYWRMCRERMETLPANVRATYRGAVAAADVPGVLAAHDLFFLPTMEENYGHVIREALAAATPVLISDQTPWRNLAAAQIGWDLPLDRPEAFREVLEQCIIMDAPTFAGWSARAAAYAWQLAADDSAVEASSAPVHRCSLARLDHHLARAESSMRAEEVLQHREEARPEGRVAEVLRPAALPGGPQAHGEIAIAQQEHESIRKVGRASQVDVIASLALHIHLGGGVVHAGDDRYAVSHRLDVDQTESLSAARHGEDGRLGPHGVYGCVGNEPGDLDAGRGGRARRQRSDPNEVRAIADDQELRLGYGARHRWPDVDQCLMALVAAGLQASQHEHHRRPIRPLRRRRVIAFGAEPANSRARKAAVRAFRALARVGGIDDEEIGPAGSVQPIGARAFPHFDAVDPREQRAAPERQPVVRTHHAERIGERVGTAQGRSVHRGGEPQARAARRDHLEAEVADTVLVVESDRPQPQTTVARLVGEHAAHQSRDARDAAISGAQRLRREGHANRVLAHVGHPSGAPR